MAIRTSIVLTLISLCIQVSPTHAQHDRTQNYSTSWPTNHASATASLCEARTINYITHSLPQFCLTNTWVSTSFTQNDISASATPTPSTQNGGAYNSSTPVAADQSTYNAKAPSESEYSEEPPDGEPSSNTFMSFEDWKEMMLRQTGQDPQDLKSRKSNPSRAHERIPPDLGHFDLGEEEEISLDFDNYLQKPNPDNLAPETNVKESDIAEHNQGDPYVADRVHRSKDAGKTCKERFSYSSFDAGATVLKSGPGTKNAKAILVEHKDSYMLLECSAQSKYVIVELSDDILIDTVVLANFEFFSSMIRHFRVSVSDRYPVKVDRWNTIGTFEARNSRDIQPFLVENPLIWAKYVRLEFLTHYGNEYYCPVSLLRIHGSRLLDSWKDTELGLDDGSDEDDDHEQHDTIDEDEITEEHHTAPQNQSDDPLESAPESTGVLESNGRTTDPAGDEYVHEAPSGQICLICSSLLVPQFGTCSAKRLMPPDVARYHDCSGDFPSISAGPVSMSKRQFPDDQLTMAASQTRSPVPDSSKTSSPTTSEYSDTSSSPHSSTHQKSQSTNQTSVKETTSVTTTSTANTKTTTPTPGSKQRGGGASGGSPPAPTVQEGFFNVITKRLHNVETNLTLSLQYLEDQSRHLQEAFHKAEQKQLLKVTNFLENLNQTVFSELRGIRMQYDQIWQSTIIALETQREQSERDIVALGTRLNLLADEVVFQKRMAIVQAVLLLCCLFLVIFSRGVPIPYIAPLLEHNNPAGPHTVSPPVLPTKSYLLGQSSPSGKNLVPRAPESTNNSASHVGSRRPVLSRMTMPEPGSKLEPYQEGGLSPPTTSGAQTSDDDELGSTTELDVHNSALHRAGGYQTSHCRKPLPALPEHPSSPS